MKTIPAVILFACLFCAAAVYALDARLTDVSGQEHVIKSARLSKGSRIDIECGGVRIRAPLKSVKSMTLDQTRIKSIDGRLHFGAEIMMRDSVRVGSDGDCFVSADNGIAGKRAKARVTIPLNRLAAVYILGKEDRVPKGADGAQTTEDAQGTEDAPIPEDAEGGESADAENADE